MKIILLVLSFFLCFIVTFDLFIKEPPVWPDEASLIQISNISRGDILADYYHYPSIYPLFLDLVFSLTSISIEVQRGISLFVGFVFMIIFCFFVLKISKTISNSTKFIAIPIILLVTDFTFLQATRVGRPEIMTLLFGFISIYLLLNYLEKKGNRLFFILSSFIFSLLAFLIHFNGFIYLATIIFFTILDFKKSRNMNNKVIIVFAILLIATAYITLRFGSTFINISKRLEIANAQNSWIFTVFSSKPIELKLIYLSLLVITSLFVFYVIHKRQIQLYVLLIPILLSWVIIFLNKDFWYAVYIIPYSYLALFIMISTSYKKLTEIKIDSAKYRFIFTIIICFTILLANLKFHINILAEEGGDRYSYQKYITDIRKIIPDNTSIFTSSIPDPFYAFTDRKNNPLTRFPQGFVENGGFLKELNETDYIIYNGPYGSNYYGNLVLDYLRKNLLKITQIGGVGQYQAIIAELKPRNQRVNP